MVSSETVELLRLHQHYRAGHLYVAGGIADQPNFYAQAMAFVESQAGD
ncbi:hypothetical protein ACJJH9_00010 (plasmid) [Microbulbifer sp. DLAB2-AF]